MRWDEQWDWKYFWERVPPATRVRVDRDMTLGISPLGKEGIAYPVEQDGFVEVLFDERINMRTPHFLAWNLGYFIDGEWLTFHEIMGVK